jgi:hypothetical protein
MTREWSFSDDRELWDGRKRGFDTNALAKIVGRPESAVQKRMVLLRETFHENPDLFQIFSIGRDFKGGLTNNRWRTMLEKLRPEKLE